MSPVIHRVNGVDAAGMDGRESYIERALNRREVLSGPVEHICEVERNRLQHGEAPGMGNSFMKRIAKGRFMMG